jgi:hypothetical protein
MIKTVKDITLILVATLLIYCNTPSSNQDTSHISIIEKDVVVFMEDLMSAGDWDGMTDMMYPKIFTLSSKEQVKAQMKQMEDMGINITGTNTKVAKISDIIRYGKEKFCEVSYKSDLKIKISGQATEMITLLEGQFKQVYGSDNVVLDEENSQFLVDANKSMIAVASIDKNDWAYFEFNTNEPKILELLLPDDVQNYFLNHN